MGKTRKWEQNHIGGPATFLLNIWPLLLFVTWFLFTRSSEIPGGQASGKVLLLFLNEYLFLGLPDLGPKSCPCMTFEKFFRFLVSGAFEHDQRFSWSPFPSLPVSYWWGKVGYMQTRTRGWLVIWTLWRTQPEMLDLTFNFSARLHIQILCGYYKLSLWVRFSTHWPGSWDIPRWLVLLIAG